MIPGIVASVTPGSGPGPEPPDPLDIVLQFQDGYTPPAGDELVLQFTIED